MTLHKFEGRYSVGAVADTLSVTDSGGTSVVTVNAALTNYYLTDSGLLATIVAALNADTTLAGTYSATLDDDSATSTGKVTISVSGGGATPSITWVGTGLRNALGFTGNLSGAATYQSSSASPYVWLPNQRISEPMTPGGNRGIPVTDATVTIAPSGHSKGLQYATRYVSGPMTFRMLAGNKTWTALETVTNESLQTFWNTTIGKTIPVRFHYDRATDGSHRQWRLQPTFNVTPEIPGFVGEGSTGTSTLWAWRTEGVESI